MHENRPGVYIFRYRQQAVEVDSRQLAADAPELIAEDERNADDAQRSAGGGETGGSEGDGRPAAIGWV